jgi:hypothetical protein
LENGEGLENGEELENETGVATWQSMDIYSIL